MIIEWLEFDFFPSLQLHVVQKEYVMAAPEYKEYIY